MTAAAELAADREHGPASTAARRRARWSAAASAAMGVVALAAVAAPTTIAAAAIAIQRPDALPDGDQAADELALMRSTHFAQLVGNYSRFQWNHPGPSWFYALDPFYVPLGGHSWAAYVAVLGLHAVIGGLIVAAVWRRAGSLAAMVTTALLLLYVRALGESVFRLVWPPYGPMLPVILLFVLAAAGAAGSTPAMAGALIAGSFVAQLHVGTAPVVIAVLASMALIRVVAGLAAPGARERPVPGRAPRLVRTALTAGGCAVAVAMWVPVAIDQATGRPGNLTKLYLFFSAHHDVHPYGAALSALGRLLLVYPFKQLPDTFGAEAAGVPPQRLLAIALFVAAAAALALLGARLRDRFALALGLLLLVAVPVVTISITRIVGPLYPYLLVWVTTFPVLLAVGWTALLARLRPWARRLGPVPVAAPRAAAAALCVLVLALTAGRVVAFQRLPPALGDEADPGTRTAWAITAAALAGEPRRSVRVDIADDRWIMASGLVLQLRKAGWTVTVDRDHVFIFGDDTRPSGTEAVELVVVSAANVQAVEVRRPGLRSIGQAGDAYLLVGRPAGPAG